MKLVYISLLFTILFVGCGYKADPIYVNSDTQDKEK